MTDDDAGVVFLDSFVDEFGIAGNVEFLAAALSVRRCVDSDNGASGFLQVGKGFFPAGRIAFPAVNQKDFGVIAGPGISLEMVFVMMECFLHSILEDFGEFSILKFAYSGIGKKRIR